MLVDVCVNISNGQFKADRDDVLRRALDAGVRGVVLTATDLLSAEDAIALCEANAAGDGLPALACTAGVHPHDVAALPGDWAPRLEELCASPHVRAVGEMGLDFNRNYSPPDLQREAFDAQLDIAQRVNKALFVHDRDSEGAVLEHLVRAGTLPRTVVHCFTGSRAELEAYIEHGVYIGITGWIADTHRGASLREIVHLIPDNRLLVETDAPFLKPHNAPDEHVVALTGVKRNKRRNEPALLPYVVAALAEARGQTEVHVAAVTHANARDVFGL